MKTSVQQPQAGAPAKVAGRPDQPAKDGRRWPLLARLPACLFGLSAVAYFAVNEGLRNHLLLLKKALLLVWKQLS